MISLNDWQKLGKHKRINNHSIFVVVQEPQQVPADPNEIQTVLFLHGFPTASWDWCKIWGDINRQYRCIAFDYLGFGFSDKPNNHNYSIFEHADMAEAVLEIQGISEYHLFSHDYGDTVAQEVLARQVEGISKAKCQTLTLLNGGVFPETHRALLAQKLLLSPVGRYASRLMSKSTLQQSISKTFGPDSKPSQDEIDAFWDLISFNNGQRNFHLLIKYMTQRIDNRERWVQCLSDTTIPIALINGSADPVSGAHMVDRYLEVVGSPSYLARLSKVGHYPQMEDPKSVVKHFLAFIKDCGV